MRLHDAVSWATGVIDPSGTEDGVNRLLAAAYDLRRPVTAETVWKRLSTAVRRAEPSGDDWAVHTIAALAAYRVECPIEAEELRGFQLIMSAVEKSYGSAEDVPDELLEWLRQQDYENEVDEWEAAHER